MYEIEFFNNERMAEFWEMATGLIKFAAPGVLIFVAIMCVGLLLNIVIDAVKQGSKDKDDDDFDIKYYK